MHPNHFDMFGQQRDSGNLRPNGGASQRRDVSDGRSLRAEDSWIDISSQPSSSSLSSAGDNEIITTGLQVETPSDEHIRRLRRSGARSQDNQIHTRRPVSAGGSSQEEYDESESESDRVLNSSNEDILSTARRRRIGQAQDELRDIQMNVIPANEMVFTPQPNAFSHPPSSQRTHIGSTPAPDSYFPPHEPSQSAPVSSRQNRNSTLTQRNSASSRLRLDTSRTSPPRQQHSPYNNLNPSHTFQPDHDAALRASLSTLLSCAAAVRAPKTSTETRTDPRIGPSTAPTSLRLVPQSAIYDSDNDTVPVRRPRLAATGISRSGSASPPNGRTIATKRKARESSKERNTSAKKTKAAQRAAIISPEELLLSPTLMSWMISAGVVLVFSAISFSVGYAYGKEFGYAEGMRVSGSGASCGKEAVKSGVRRLRWTSGAGSVAA